MKTFRIVPEIILYDKVSEFCQGMEFDSGDIIFINDVIYECYFKGRTGRATIIDYGKYAIGEPTDQMVEAIFRDIQGIDVKRIIGIGGGAILDVAKLFSLRTISPVTELFERTVPCKRDKELVLVPTTCGTGSETTNISILELTTRNTKMGLADDNLYAEIAVLIPELIAGLPYRVFATSSIDALVHSMESFTSPKASEFSRIYSRQAMRMILKGYQELTEWKTNVLGRTGLEENSNNMAYTGPIDQMLTKSLRKDFLLASTYAGIAFGNAGCAAVHAMSYPLGAKYHVPHGESNYVLLLAVYREYQKLAPEGIIRELNSYLGEILNCDEWEVYDQLEELLSSVLDHKPMSAYGVTHEDIREFTRIVMTGQGRLMSNNYTELNESDVERIYKRVF